MSFTSGFSIRIEKAGRGDSDVDVRLIGGATWLVWKEQTRRHVLVRWVLSDWVLMEWGYRGKYQDKKPPAGGPGTPRRAKQKVEV